MKITFEIVKILLLSLIAFHAVEQSYSFGVMGYLLERESVADYWEVGYE